MWPAFGQAEPFNHSLKGGLRIDFYGKICRAPTSEEGI
jgi:hypothetical protein